MLSAVLLFLACAATVSSSGMANKIQRNIDVYNADVACWGKDNALAFHVGIVQAIDQCTNFGKPSNLLKPANPWKTVQSANTLPEYESNAFCVSFYYLYLLYI